MREDIPVVDPYVDEVPGTSTSFMCRQLPSIDFKGSTERIISRIVEPEGIPGPSTVPVRHEWDDDDEITHHTSGVETEDDEEEDEGSVPTTPSEATQDEMFWSGVNPFLTTEEEITIETDSEEEEEDDDDAPLIHPFEYPPSVRKDEDDVICMGSNRARRGYITGAKRTLVFLDDEEMDAKRQKTIITLDD